MVGRKRQQSERSARRDLDRHDPDPWSDPARRAPGLPGCPRALVDHQLCRRRAQSRHGRADGARWPHELKAFPATVE